MGHVETPSMIKFMYRSVYGRIGNIGCCSCRRIHGMMFCSTLITVCIEIYICLDEKIDGLKLLILCFTLHEEENDIFTC